MGRWGIAVKAFLRGTWESKQLLVSLCRPVAFFSLLSLSVFVCGCVSLSEPPIHNNNNNNNNNDATTAWRQNAGWDRVQNFSVPKTKRKTIKFCRSFICVSFLLFHLVASLCDILMQISILILSIYLSLSLYVSFSLEILRRVNLE